MTCAPRSLIFFAGVFAPFAVEAFIPTAVSRMKVGVVRSLSFWVSIIWFEPPSSGLILCF